jgi:2-iminobutanoate/2-iminopropanoate deaminase
MEEIATDRAPQSIGPFSQAIKLDDRIHVSGQGPVDPETGEVVSDEIEEQTVQTLENVGAILEAGGSSLEDILKTTVYLTDMDSYDAVNSVYEQYVTEPYPARATVEVAQLPIDIGVEIEAVARVE